jgi:AAA+ ATPase superfamily predicted ATPase
MRKMKNPFQYGGVVAEDAFCNRRKEIEELLRAIENNEKLLVYSERRLGKTSLIQLVMNRLPEGEYLCVYIDLWPTDGEISFITSAAKAISEAMSTTAGKLLDNARAFFGSLKPQITVDDSRKPVVTFGISRVGKPTLEMDEVLTAPAKIANQRKRKVLIVFDEFQQILEYDTDIIERRLRSIIQTHENVSYIFLGSRKHLIQKMFMDSSHPLYRAAGHYPLRTISQEDWLPFIKKRFLDADKQISDEEIHSICRSTEGHPFYTQHLCHVIWELCEAKSQVTEDMIKSAVDILLDRESYAYTTLWESLAKNQRRFLYGLARERDNIKPYAADFIRPYGLSSASSVQRVIEALLERDIVDRDNDSFVITDRFFSIWIRRM